METSRLINTFCRLPVPGHVRSLHESPADPVRGFGAYRKQGERCLWAFDENTLAEVKGALKKAGVSVGAAVDSGSLRILSKRETYLSRRHSLQDRERLLQDIPERERYEQSLRDANRRPSSRPGGKRRSSTPGLGKVRPSSPTTRGGCTIFCRGLWPT